MAFETPHTPTTNAGEDLATGSAARKRKRFNLVLWIIQVLVALVFLFAGGMKLMMPATQLAQASPLPVLFLRFIAVCELLGALGLILPGLLRIQTGLTTLAAACLLIILIGATVVTLMGPQAKAFPLPLVTGLLTAFIAYGRWRLAPLENR